MKHCGTLRLETDRLILRKYVSEDAPAKYRNWTSDSEVTKFLMWKTHPNLEFTQKVTDECVEQYSNDNFYRWAIVLKDNDEPIGDIAVAANKGRRTIYTYFKNKEDIYYAVIETELFQLAHKLQSEMQKNLNPAEKLINYIYARMGLFSETVTRNGNLKASFFSNIHVVEKSRLRLDIREKKMLENILIEGNEQGLFNVKNPRMAATLIHCSLKGWEVPFIRGDFKDLGFLSADNKKNFVAFLISGLKEKETLNIV